jgi:hypothetical protein
MERCRHTVSAYIWPRIGYFLGELVLRTRCTDLSSASLSLGLEETKSDDDGFDDMDPIMGTVEGHEEASMTIGAIGSCVLRRVFGGATVD